MANCNVTYVGSPPLCGSYTLWMLFAAVCTALVLSLCWNILCCFGKQCTANGKWFLPQFRSSLNMRQSEMEDNPIYGNVTYTLPRTDIARTPTISNNRQVTRNTVKVPADPSQQDCYANLKLKVPKAKKGRRSPSPSLCATVPQVQYTDVATVPRKQEQEDFADILETTSLLSDLYASVDTKQNRSKTMEGTEDYANHV